MNSHTYNKDFNIITKSFRTSANEGVRFHYNHMRVSTSLYFLHYLALKRNRLVFLGIIHVHINLSCVLVNEFIFTDYRSLPGHKEITRCFVAVLRNLRIFKL